MPRTVWSGHPGAHALNVREPDRIGINIELLLFVGRVNLENLEKNSQSKVRTNSKLNPHGMASTGIVLGFQ